MINLDVLVVYSAGIALSSLVLDAVSMHPFALDSAQANYNLSYAYFLESCKKLNLKAGFTTSLDIIGPGTCQSYWTYENETWEKVHAPAQASQIFDKISPVSPVRAAERELLFSEKNVQPFNDVQLFVTFFDKQKTYTNFPEYSIPTVSVTGTSAAHIQLAILQLKNLIARHPYNEDFSKKLVLKDRFGAGGNHVYEVTHDYLQTISSLVQENPGIHFILQPFLLFDQGYSHNNQKGTSDIRIIYQHDEIIQCYIRTAQANDFRCNEHQGGTLTYMKDDDIPHDVLKISGNIVEKIAKPNALYALDFSVCNSGRTYFMEGNIGPGLDWNDKKKINEVMSKQLIDAIVTEISARA